jgi:hypothetical protein
MSRRGWMIAGAVVLVLVVVVIVAVVLTQRGPNVRRVRVSGGGGAAAPDATFTVDSAGRYPSDEGWVDEGASVDV